jgi:hypothetical protein
LFKKISDNLIALLIFTISLTNFNFDRLARELNFLKLTVVLKKISQFNAYSGSAYPDAYHYDIRRFSCISIRTQYNKF